MNKLESGRSMVEMLGVLAIIGVLSVGGIAGYTMAMNKYKANEIVNAISMTYMLGMSADKGQGANTSYSTVGTMPTGATSIDFAKTDKTVVAKISDKGVCNQVKNQLGDKVTAGDCETATSGVYSLTISMESATVNIITQEPGGLGFTNSTCPNGYVSVNGPSTACVKTLEDAVQFCRSINLQGARIYNEEQSPWTYTCY